METYHRKRSRRDAINTNTVQEVMSLKRQETSSIVGGAQAQPPPLARQILLQSNVSMRETDEVSDEQQVELGSVYEIYHKNLPPRTPAQLRSTRVVMVSEKTDLNVAIRYPSIGSLRTYFSNRIKEMYPALDEKFVMGTKLAGKVLLRQVPSQEFAEKKHSEGFWLVNPNSLRGLGDVTTKKDDTGGLVTELKNNGMVRWGVRRQVMFIGKHREMSKTQSSSSLVEGDEVREQVVDHDEDDGVEEESNDDEEEVEDEAEEDKNDEEVEDGVEEKDDEEVEDGVEDKDDEEVEDEETLEYSLKRKRKSTRNLKKRKQIKRENQWQPKKPKRKSKKVVLKDPTDRWSKERYMAAEQSLLEVMKAKKAMIGNPIVRPVLRAEARKRIGDTGLLDHLLKHVANKVAPGGTLRFRRWHNADGAMEYWLENADLLKIRKDAGVKDPFWTPPPGWKLGDSPIQDPIMAKEVKKLKDEISDIKGFIEESNKKHEEEMANLRREIEELTSKKQEKIPVTAVCDSVGTSSNQLNLNNSLVPLDLSQLHNAVVPREKYKEQMLAISDFLKKIEVWMHGEVGKDTSKMEEKTKAGKELISTTEEDSAEKESDNAEEAEKSKAVAPAKEVGEETSEGSGQTLATAEPQPQPQPPSAEAKAAKIERLKSGFRICKPQGTFLWPNMVKNPTTSSENNLSSKVVLQVEDHLVAPTPPSVNSSTAPPLPYHHHHPHPASPVKPVPERRAVTVTVSTVSEGLTGSCNEGLGNNYSSSTTTTTTIIGSKTTSPINLNDSPINPLYENLSSKQTVTTNSVMPNLLPSAVKRETTMSASGGSGGGHPWGAYRGNCPAAGYKNSHQESQDKRNSTSSWASSSSSGAPNCLSNTGTPTWLALASPYTTFNAHSSQS